MPPSDTQQAEQQQKPPPGYPQGDSPAPKKSRFPRTAKKGERGFLEGCLAGLCCCWICEECCF